MGGGNHDDDEEEFDFEEARRLDQAGMKARDATRLRGGVWGPECVRGGNAPLQPAAPPPPNMFDGLRAMPSIDGPGGNPFAEDAATGNTWYGDGTQGDVGGGGEAGEQDGAGAGVETENGGEGRIVEIYEDYPESQEEGQQKKSKLKKVKKTWIYVATQQLSRPECRYIMCVLSTIANTTRRGHLCELVNSLSSPSSPPHSSTPVNDLMTIAHSIKATTTGSHIIEFWRMVGYMQFALVVDWYALLHSFYFNANDVSFKGVLP